MGCVISSGEHPTVDREDGGSFPPAAVGPFYLASMLGEVKDPTRGKCVTCRGF